MRRDAGLASLGAPRGRPRMRPGTSPGFLGGDRIEGLVPAIAIAMSAGMVLNGFNSAMGQAICCIVNCATLILLLLERPPARARWSEVLPVLALCGAALLWVVLVSVALPAGDPSAPFAPDLFAAQLLSFVAGIAALLCGWLVGLRWQRTRHVLDWLIALSCLYLVLGLVLRDAGTDATLDYWTLVRDDRFQGVVGNVNVTAALAGATAVLALSRVFATAAGRRGAALARGDAVVAGLHCVAVLIALGAAIATASRFTNLLTLATLAVLGGWNLVRHVGRVRHVRHLRAIGAMLAGVALAAVLLVTQLSDLLIERLAGLPDGIALRETMWRQYLAIAAQAPVTGHGFGSFPIANAFYLTTPRFAEANWAVNSAHNWVLQILLNGGLPYLALLLAASFWLCAQIGIGLRRRWTPDAVGSAVAIVLIVACGSIDIALDVPATVTLMLFLAGSLWGSALMPAQIRVAQARRAPREQERQIAR